MDPRVFLGEEATTTFTTLQNDLRQIGAFTPTYPQLPETPLNQSVDNPTPSSTSTTAHRTPKPPKHKCPVCADAFSNERALGSHMHKAHELSLFRCDFCSEEFSRKDNWKHHVKTKHPGIFDSMPPPPLATPPSTQATGTPRDDEPVTSTVYKEEPDTVKLLLRRLASSEDRQAKTEERAAKAAERAAAEVHRLMAENGQLSDDVNRYTSEIGRLSRRNTKLEDERELAEQRRQADVDRLTGETELLARETKRLEKLCVRRRRKAKRARKTAREEKRRLRRVVETLESRVKELSRDHFSRVETLHDSPVVGNCVAIMGESLDVFY